MTIDVQTVMEEGPFMAGKDATQRTAEINKGQDSGVNFLLKQGG